MKAKCERSNGLGRHPCGGDERERAACRGQAAVLGFEGKTVASKSNAPTHQHLIYEGLQRFEQHPARSGKATARPPSKRAAEAAPCSADRERWSVSDSDSRLPALGAVLDTT